MTECSCDPGVDVALAGCTAGLRRDHIDFDLAVVGREPVFDAGNDRDGRAGFAEMPRPRFIEGRIVVATREIDLRVDCQSAFKFDPRSASNFDPFVRRVLAVALAPSELAGVAETARAR